MLGSCVATGVSCVSFDICIVVGGGGVVGVVVAVSTVESGSVATDVVSAGIDSAVVVFVTTKYIELVLISTALIVDVLTML